jgi:putative oxidoreductase
MVLTFLGKYREGGLLFLRLGLGIMFIIHGAPKILGGPAGWHTLGKAIGAIGIHGYPTFFGFMAAFSECFGGIFLILGLFFRPACILLAITMIVATATLVKRNEKFPTLSHPIELGIVFASLVLIGPGKYSIDKN